MRNFILLIPLGYLIAIAIPLALTDLRERRLPNSLTISAALLTIICLAAAALLGGEWQSFLSALAAAVVTFFVGWFLAARAAIGMGDIKLLLSLNAFAGYFSPLLPLISLAISLVAATLVSSILLFRNRLTLKASIALGPYLLLGFFIAVTPSALAVTVAVGS